MILIGRIQVGEYNAKKVFLLSSHKQKIRSAEQLFKIVIRDLRNLQKIINRGCKDFTLQSTSTYDSSHLISLNLSHL